MIYRVCEHYDDNPEIIQEKYNECFICFEYKIDNETKPITLQKQQLYFNNCTCNSSVHNSCLKIWVIKNKSCPICRINVIENNKETIVFHKYIPYGIKIYFIIKTISIRFLNLFSILLFFYLMIDFYLILFKTKYIPYNDYTYIPIPILGNEFIEYLNKSDNINYNSPQVL